MITTKKINEGQLTVELGAGLNILSWREDHPDEEMAGKSIISYADGSEDDSDLIDAVNAHVADDEWIDPSPVPVKPLTEVEKLQAKAQHLQDQLDDSVTDMLNVYDILILNGLV